MKLRLFIIITSNKYIESLLKALDLGFFCTVITKRRRVGRRVKSRLVHIYCYCYDYYTYADERRVIMRLTAPTLSFSRLILLSHFV